MAVSSEVARVVHTANGTATFFSYSPIDGATSANLKVYLFNPSTGVLTLQTIGTDYTFGGGGVTFTNAPPSGRRVILHRVVPLLQPDNYKTNAPFPAVVTENRFDEVVRGIQQINDIAQNRAIILPLGDAGFSTNTLPAVEDRKGRVLYFNATTGDPEAKALADTVVTASPWAQSFLSQPTSAAGLANIGAVAKAGDTMTGDLTLPGPPTAANHAATKGYVDTEVGARVAKAGDTMTGPLTLPGPPTANNHAATKDYVDSQITAGPYVLKAGDTMTGLLTLSGAPTATNHAATKGYVDSTAVAKTGDTMTGFLTLHADPTAAMHAATKQYVDNSISSSSATVTLSGASVEFLGIPSWARRLRLFIWGAAAAAATTFFVRLSNSASYPTSGYDSITSAVASSVATISNGASFLVSHQTTFSITGLHSVMDCILADAASNRWIVASRGGATTNGIPHTFYTVGNIALSGTLDRLMILAGASTFSAGQARLEWGL